MYVFECQERRLGPLEPAWERQNPSHTVSELFQICIVEIVDISEDPHMNKDLGNADESETRAEEPDLQNIPDEHPEADTTANLKNESPAHS